MTDYNTSKPLSFGMVRGACHHCGAFSHQDWYAAFADETSNLDSVSPSFSGQAGGFKTRVTGLYFSSCASCRRLSVWVGGGLVFPFSRGDAPQPNADMPDDVLSDYMEAAAIVKYSPRSAAALLRLAVEKLCRNIGGQGSIDKMIGDLVAKGLDTRIQKALDTLRVIGNESVHPGQMDLKDDVATASSLFGLLNLVVDRMISEPRHIDEMYALLPKGKVEGINNRDKPKPAS